MAVQRDSAQNEDSDIRQMSDEALVRLIAQGRESEQPQEQNAAARAWEQLVVREYDRVRGLVVTVCWRGFENVRVDPNHYDDATQKAFERCLEKLGKGFLGTSVGEFKNAVGTCASELARSFERPFATVLREPMSGARYCAPTLSRVPYLCAAGRLRGGHVRL